MSARAPRSSSGLTVGLEAVEALIRAAERRGLSRSRLLREGGLEVLPRSRVARLPCEDYARLWEAIESRLADPDLGLHIAEDFLLEGDSLFERVSAAGDTVGDFLLRLGRFVSLFNSNIIMEVDDSPKGPTLTLRTRIPSLAGGRHAHERILANVIIRARVACGFPFAAQRVRFKHPQPNNITEHRRVFGVTPDFNAGVSSLTLSPQNAARPLLTADPRLRTALDDVVEHLLERVTPPQTLSEAVRSRVLANLETRLGLAAIAQGLHMSARTLQRKLKNESNVSFESIRDELRKQIALDAVARSATNVEVTCRLGFRDESSFERAFKRWTRMTPSQYRNASRGRKAP